MKKSSFLAGLGFLGVLPILLLHSPLLPAQTAAEPFEQLKLVLDKGDKIILEDFQGNQVSGKINRMSSGSIELRANGKTETYSADRVSRITWKKPDSPLNGYLIGFAAGFAPMLPAYMALLDEDERGLAVVGALLWGLMGGGIGALVDAAIQKEKVVFEGSKKRVSWSLQPIFSEKTYRENSPLGKALPTCEGAARGLRIAIRF